MPGSFTLTIFVTDHGIRNNQQQGYVGARPAFTGDEATNGKSHDKNTFKFDARAKCSYSRSIRTFRVICLCFLSELTRNQ